MIARRGWDTNITKYAISNHYHRRRHSEHTLDAHATLHTPPRSKSSVHHHVACSKARQLCEAAYRLRRGVDNGGLTVAAVSCRESLLALVSLRSVLSLLSLASRLSLLSLLPELTELSLLPPLFVLFVPFVPLAPLVALLCGLRNHS